MKKLLIISLLLCGIVLGGCSLQKGLSQEELFEKKQECAKYKNNIEDIIQQKCEEYSSPNIEHMNCYLEEIYFNPKSNSCEYSWYGNYYQFTDGNIRDDSSSERRYYVYDYLSSKEIYSNVCGKSDYQCNTLAKKIIKEIKGE